MLLKKTYDNYKDIIPYIFFGICTTVLNVAVYWLLTHTLGLSVMAGTVESWIVAVLFAYLTNRKWVFHSKAVGIKSMLREISVFFLCRLATGVVDWIFMWVFVDVLSFNDIIIKICSNIIVILLNYIASRFMIFKR